MLSCTQRAASSLCQKALQPADGWLWTGWVQFLASHFPQLLLPSSWDFERRERLTNYLEELSPHWLLREFQTSRPQTVEGSVWLQSYSWKVATARGSKANRTNKLWTWREIQCTNQKMAGTEGSILTAKSHCQQRAPHPVVQQARPHYGRSTGRYCSNTWCAKMKKSCGLCSESSYSGYHGMITGFLSGEGILTLSFIDFHIIEPLGTLVSLCTKHKTITCDLQGCDEIWKVQAPARSPEEKIGRRTLPIALSTCLAHRKCSKYDRNLCWKHLTLFRAHSKHTVNVKTLYIPVVAEK